MGALHVLWDDVLYKKWVLLLVKFMPQLRIVDCRDENGIEVVFEVAVEVLTMCRQHVSCHSKAQDFL